MEGNTAIPLGGCFIFQACVSHSQCPSALAHLGQSLWAVTGPAHICIQVAGSVLGPALCLGWLLDKGHGVFDLLDLLLWVVVFLLASA